MYRTGPKHWDLMLAPLMFGVMEAPQASTGYSLSELTATENCRHH